MKYVNTKENVVDILPKPQPTTAFQQVHGKKNRFVNVFNSKGGIVEIIVQMLIDTTNAANDNKG